MFIIYEIPFINVPQLVIINFLFYIHKDTYYRISWYTKNTST